MDTYEDKHRKIFNCWETHCSLSRPLRMDFDDFAEYCANTISFSDETLNQWCDNCSYIEECDIRIAERWNNGGELLSNENRFKRIGDISDPACS